MSVASPGAARDDEARDTRTFFDEGHDAVDGECRDHVQARHRQVDFDAARGFLLCLHGEHGQFGHRHREGHRRVLEDVHRLAGERRNDDAECHGQQHVAVVLHRGEAQRHARVALAARQGLDARAHLLGDPCGCEESQRQHHEDEAGNALHHRKDGGHHVIPQEDLHQQRNVAEQLHPCIAEADQKFVVRQRADRPDDQPRDQRDHQRQQGHRNGPAPGREHPLEVGRVFAPRVLQEDLPIPIRSHGNSFSNRLTS